MFLSHFFICFVFIIGWVSYVLSFSERFDFLSSWQSGNVCGFQLWVRGSIFGASHEFPSEVYQHFVNRFLYESLGKFAYHSSRYSWTSSATLWNILWLQLFSCCLLLSRLHLPKGPSTTDHTFGHSRQRLPGLSSICLTLLNSL